VVLVEGLLAKRKVHLGACDEARHQVLVRLAALRSSAYSIVQTVFTPRQKLDARDPAANQSP
jgi:hypothetical protein